MRRGLGRYVFLLALLNGLLLFTASPTPAMAEPCPNGTCRDCTSSCPGGDDCKCCWGWCYGCPRDCDE